jgi:hypothetical protein
MDNKDEIKTILNKMLEDELPSTQIGLWPAVRAHLVAGNKPVLQQGAKMNRNFDRKWMAVVLTLIALLAAGFTTPQGRALAQGVMELFSRAESQLMPLQPGQVVSPQSEGVLPTAMPPSPLTSVEEAGAQAGFQAAQLTSVPSGLEFLGARLYGKKISLEYAAAGGEGSLILMQSQDGFLESDWDRVPAADIIPVQVSGVSAEFVQGTFVVLAGESSGSWNSSAPILRLRWVKDGTWYELTRSGEKGAVAGLDQAAMIALAESLQDPVP